MVLFNNDDNLDDVDVVIRGKSLKKLNCITTLVILNNSTLLLTCNNKLAS